MKKSIAAARKAGPSQAQMVSAGGFTAVLLVILSGAATAVTLYLR